MNRKVLVTGRLSHGDAGLITLYLNIFSSMPLVLVLSHFNFVNVFWCKMWSAVVTIGLMVTVCLSL